MEIAALEVFHVAAACNLNNMRLQKLSAGNWHYLNSNNVKHTVCLYKMMEYMGVSCLGMWCRRSRSIRSLNSFDRSDASEGRFSDNIGISCPWMWNWMLPPCAGP